MAQFDRLTEKMLRGFASRTSRRNVFSVLGGFLAGAAALPLLPVARAAESEPNGSDPNSGVTAPRYSGNPQDPGDVTKCDYWRYCAIDGSLCSCYGGTVTSCPPGTEMSPITWIGTCSNPADKRNYIISNAKIEKTGFNTQVKLQTGIRELIKGYQVIQRNHFGNS